MSPFSIALPSFLPRRTAARDELRHVTLQQRQLLVRPRPRGQRVRCDSGCIWLTFDGDPVDVVLEAGESFLCVGKGKLIVQALTNAEVTLGRGRV